MKETFSFCMTLNRWIAQSTVQGRTGFKKPLQHPLEKKTKRSSKSPFFCHFIWEIVKTWHIVVPELSGTIFVYYLHGKWHKITLEKRYVRLCTQSASLRRFSNSMNQSICTLWSIQLIFCMKFGLLIAQPNKKQVIFFLQAKLNFFFIDFQLLITTPYLVFSKHVRFMR
jgi:hypothetical protein